MDSKALILRVLVQCKGSTKKQQGPNKTNNPIMLGLHTYLLCFNCSCMGRFDASGTSKNDNLLKVLVGHGVKKYGIEIFFRGLQAELCPFVYIL